MKQAIGVLHIGAHYGQESSYYYQNGLKVIWVEALPDIFKKLQSNISCYENLIAFCALVGDKNLIDNDFSYQIMMVLHLLYIELVKNQI